MKLINKEIDMVVQHDTKGNLRPMRFRIHGDYGQLIVIGIDKIVSVEHVGENKNPVRAYMCKSIVEGIERIYELRFIVVNMKWILYRM